MNIVKLLKRTHKKRVEAVEDAVIRIMPHAACSILLDADYVPSVKIHGLNGKPNKEQLVLLRKAKVVLDIISSMASERDAAITYGVSRKIAYKWYESYMRNVLYILNEYDGSPVSFNGVTIDNATASINCVAKSLSSHLSVEARDLAVKLYI